MNDWKDLFRPNVAQWVLGDICPEEVPANDLLPFENPDFYDDSEVVSRLEHVQGKERFSIGATSGTPVAVADSSKSWRLVQMRLKDLNLYGIIVARASIA